MPTFKMLFVMISLMLLLGSSITLAAPASHSTATLSRIVGGLRTTDIARTFDCQLFAHVYADAHPTINDATIVLNALNITLETSERVLRSTKRLQKKLLTPNNKYPLPSCSPSDLLKREAERDVLEEHAIILALGAAQLVHARETILQPTSFTRSSELMTAVQSLAAIQEMQINTLNDGLGTITMSMAAHDALMREVKLSCASEVPSGASGDLDVSV